MLIPSKKIDEENLKLGRFLGIKGLEKEELIVPGIYHEIEKIPFLRFDKSFDWLMVVVCYLESLGYHVNIDEGSCMISKDDDSEPNIWNTCKKDITPEDLREALFNSCIEAVDDYYDVDPEISLSTTFKNIHEWNGAEIDSE